MTTSTSFAQMANNQSISLSSALRANTPPTKGQTTSRKFLTLSIFFLLSFFCTTHAWGEDTWTLVTNVSDLAVDDEVVIVANGAAQALSTTQNGNNRGQAAITKSQDKSTIATPSNSVQVLTLKDGKTSGTWAFYTGSGYLYAASSSKNYLRTETTLSANSSWTITITAAGVATIKATGTNTNNWLRYNSSSSIFSCYSSGQGDVCIYKKQATVTKTLSSITLSGQTTTYTVGDPFSFDGICTATYSDGSTKAVTPTSVSSPNMNNAGTPTIEVSYTEGGVSVNATYTITVSAVSSGDGECIWELVTDASTLNADDEIIIAASGNNNYAISITQANNNRTATAITKDGNTLTAPGNAVQILTLKTGTKSGTWAFYTGSGYLHAASSSSNFLRTQTTNNDNGSFTINIVDNVASIVAQGTYTRNTMRYNPNNGNPVFACYASTSTTGSLPCIYKKVCTGGSTQPSYSVTYNANGATSGYVPEDNTEYAKDAQVTVLGNTGTLAKTGYTFSGWNTEANGTGTTYAVGVKFNITENTTLYAQWECVTPSITAQPQSATYKQGTEATPLSVTATAEGANMSYKWQKSTNNSNWNDISEETTNTYKPSTSDAGTTYYRVIVTNAAADCQTQATSNVATIVVNACYDAVNVVKGTASNGSFTMVSGYCSTCNGPVSVTLNDIQPDAGYQFSTITQSGVDDAKVTIDNDAKTVTYAQNTTGTSTINVIFTEIPKRTVTLNPNFPTGKTGTFTYEAGELVDGSLVLSYDDGTASMTIEELYTSLTLDGYEFGGWYNAKGANPGEVSGSPCTNTGNITGDKTYYAKWSKLYSITLSENGTTKELTPQTSTSYTLPTELTAGGSCQDDTKELVGWSTVAIPTPGDKPTSKFYELGETVTLTADHTTFYAVFATAEGVASIDYTKITDINNLTDGNYVIAYGYNTTTPSIILKATTKDETTLVATSASPSSNKYQNPAAENIWTIKKSGTTYTLYNETTSKYVQANTTPALLLADANPTNFNIEYSTDHWKIKINGNTSYQLVGYTNASGNYFQTKSGVSASYKIQLYKNTSTVSYSDYTTTCDATKATVTYDLNGGTGATCEQTTVTKDEAFNLCSSTPTQNGYTFAGWSDGTKTYAAGAEVTISESTTFYAAWTAKTIKITWDQNYTDCPESETSTYIYDGEDIEMPEDPIRTGYKFNGWYTKANDGTEVTEVGDENKPSADVTYYAQWEKLHTVTFIASGQVYEKQEHKYISGDKLVLPEIDPSAANFACDGYLFEGWSKYQQTKEDANCPELVDANTLVENDLELHAVWKKASTSGAGTQIFYESFDTEDGTGGNDGKWSGDIAKNNKVNTTWTFENEGGAYQCIKLGSGSKKGSATTPALTQLSGDAILSFKAAAWNSNSESTILKLSISGGGTLTQTSVTLVKGAWTTYEVTITDGTPSSTITFAAANASNNRFFLDEVKITTSGSYNYTTSPSCGPTMVAKENVWATSAAGQSVKVNVPLGIKLFEGNATITGTSTNENFVVNTLENAGNGEHQVVVVYTPSADDTKENTTITLTAKNGEEIWCTTTFTLNGRSLPDEFVIVAQYGDKWLALPANMQSGADQYNGIEVTPNNALTQIPAAPSTTIYSLRGVADNRYEVAGTCVRLVGNGNKCLWGNAAEANTTIQNWTTLGATNGKNYEWLLTTSDGELYTIANPEHPDYNQGRILSNSGSKYGLYKGTTKFYILPVGCSSQPGNIQVTARRVDATFSWEGSASSMKIDVYTNDAMTEGNISNTATASPYYMTGLSESTQYWFKMTPNGTDKDCAYTGSFKTTGPTIDVVEWQENAAVIFVDKDKGLNPVVVIDGEVEHGVGATKATDIFFSKYFEAQGTAKLLAIYNGTANAISLADITILQRSMEKNTPLSLVNYGKTKGWIQPSEEIILYNVDAREEVMKCAEEDKTFESWNNVENNNLAFSGKGTIRLFRGNKCIDIIGAMESAEDIHDKKVTPLEGTEEPTFGDELGFITATGDNYSTPNVETNYTLSTNRCLLVRKPSVTSGAIAVEKNIGDFKTLGNDYDGIANEWAGLQVPNGPSDNKYKYTCEGFQKVGSFDYNQYYKEYQNVQPEKVLDEYKHNDATKEYIIPIENLAKYSCLNIRFQLKQGDQVLTEEPVQVPIIVSGEKATNDAIFNAIVKTDASEPLYDQSIERCKTCNVVVLSNATLTKAADDATNDVSEVYNMKVYPGGQVVVPAETNYTINSLAFRRQEDEVSMANIQGELNVKHANGVYLDVRIDPSNWHYMTLPYDCRVGDITFEDGTPAVVNTDYLLGWYDGAYRAEHKTGGWTYITDNDYILKKGLGYIVALPGDGKVRREIRFPMANSVIAEDLTSKTVSGLYAYGGDKTDAELRPNHKGWNMIGSPYLYTYTTDIVNKPLQMGTLEHSPVSPWDGTWVRTGDARYIVEPIDNGWSGYRQTTISNLKPFTSYFIQVGGVLENGEYTTVTPETEQQIVFAANSVARNASAPRKVAEAEVMDNHPVWYGVEMIAPNNEKDNTTLLISDEFTDGYDMMDDLVKMRGDYYQYYNFPVLASNNNEGEMAFNALPDSSAAKIGVPLSYYAATAGTYTIATDGRFDLEEVKAAMLYDATTAQYTNLLTENYSFTTNKGNNTNRFTLFVTVERKKVPNITTGMDNLLTNGQLSLIAVERTLVLSGLTENADIYVYDMSGKMVTGTHSAGENGIWRTTVPATGVYFVRVNSANSQQTLRTIVK